MDCNLWNILQTFNPSCSGNCFCRIADYFSQLNLSTNEGCPKSVLVIHIYASHERTSTSLTAVRQQPRCHTEFTCRTGRPVEVDVTLSLSKWILKSILLDTLHVYRNDMRRKMTIPEESNILVSGSKSMWEPGQNPSNR
ncbi:MAG: hypothetical protein R6V16_12190 [Bacteroidales bacterium]